jgi:acyl dehydratase
MIQATHAICGQASIERSFKQADFDCFARLSGDNNPIHVDPAFSSRMPFGRTVAHGLLLCSVLRGLIEQLLPGGRLVDQSVMFPAPTFAGERMCFTVAVTDTEDSGASFTLEVLRVADGTVTCQGHARVVA